MFEHFGEKGKAVKAKLEKGWKFVTEVPEDAKGRVKSFLDKVKEKTEKLPEAKRGSLWERAKILAGSFVSEILGIGREKAKAGQEADSAVAQSTEEAVKGVKEVVGVKPVMGVEQRQRVDSVFASITAALENASDTQKGGYKTAMEKITKGEKLEVEELKALSGVTLLSLYSLKKTFGVSALAKVFEAFHKGTQNKIGGEVVKKAFALGKLEGLEILNLFGIGFEMDDIEGTGTASKVGDALTNIAKKGANLNGIGDTLGEHGIIKKNPRAVVKAINAVATNFSAMNLAKMVHAIDDEDFMNLASKMLGKNPDDIKMGNPSVVAKDPEVEVAKKAA